MKYWLALLALLWSQIGLASGTIDARTFDLLMKSQELVQQNQFDQAITTLEKVKAKKNLSSYARAQMWNYFAYAYVSKESFSKAKDAYQSLLEEADAPEALKANAIHGLSQLCFQLADYDCSIRYAQQVLTHNPQDIAILMLLTQSYYQKQNYPKALDYITSVINLGSKQKRPKESWLQLKMALQYELNQYAAAEKTLRKLISYYPKERYLRQLSSLLGQQDKTKQRLAVMDALYQQGKLDIESELMNLAYLWSEHHAPYRAGQLIEQSMQDGAIQANGKTTQTLANLWQASQERNKATDALKQAAKLTHDPNLYAQLATIYYQQQDYAQALEYADKALSSTSLNQPGQVQIIKGGALFYLEKYEQALLPFRQAQRHKYSVKQATAWERYTLNEIKRRNWLASLRAQTQQ